MSTPHTPMLNPAEVVELRKLLAALPPGGRVLEWGAGGSTLAWPREFPELTWVAIEHDQGWHDRVKADLPPNVTLLLRAFPDYWRLDAGAYDLIIVDGRERVRCLDAARSYLNPGGSVVLHDAGRVRYAPGLAYYRTVKLLVPPTGGKDPRGMTLLQDPLPLRWAPSPLPGTIGAMYLCWGQPAADQALHSIQSLRSHMPDLPVVILGDTGAAVTFQGVKGVEVVDPGVDPFKGQHMFGFLAGRVKPLLARYSPFARTMYVDADTEFKRSPAPGYALLDRWDFVIAEAETRSLAQTFPDNRTEAGETALRLGTPQLLYHNSGLFWWRANQATTDLFQLWSDEWLRYQGWDEQIALLRALLVSEAVWLNVPYTWNCRGPEEAWMVYHRFASQTARKFGRGITVIPHPRGVPLAPTRPLVRVEVSPGRFVRVHAGDEAKAVEQFQRMHMAGRKTRGG